MLPILLMILKIIGIVILAVLGLALAILLLVLFVPVRYSVSGSYYGRLQGAATVTWFFHGLSLKVTYDDGLDVSVRVLGKRVFQKKEGAPEAEEEIKEGLEESAQKTAEIIGEGLSVDFVEPAEETGTKPEEQEEDNWADDFQEEEELWDTPKEDAGNAGRKKGRGRKDKGRKGKDKLKEMKESAKSLWFRLKGWKDKAVSFWNDERNRKTIKVVIGQTKAVLCHVLPRKVQGKAVFGFDDPSVTGKVLSVLSVAYGWYGDKLEIVPVFDRSILEVEGSLKGRVQAGVIAARGVRVLLNKNFRRLAWSLLKNGGI